jgi:putative effector of murein hydrolase LrgA (UPF0299 family)
MIQAVIIFYTLFLVNNGELRFYIFLALICGFAAYQALFKGVYLYFLELTIRTTIAISRFIKKTFHLLIYKPVLGLIQLVIIIILSIVRGLLSLVNFLIKVLLLILKIIFVPLQKIVMIFWKLLPKSIKKSVEKLYNRTAGIFREIKNYLSKWIKKWKRPKK